ncbi:MAG: hypothetical protein CMB80_34765 [Flammeovirgaceae bacterium]|nr:hypothetical protein [Flammeovirgaceae bacterium]|tara:strand:- start:271 stop:630 length:360 start_codon:yes stop_codon:yes gene_type:complete
MTKTQEKFTWVKEESDESIEHWMSTMHDELTINDIIWADWVTISEQAHSTYDKMRIEVCPDYRMRREIAVDENGIIHLEVISCYEEGGPAVFVHSFDEEHEAYKDFADKYNSYHGLVWE